MEDTLLQIANSGGPIGNVAAGLMYVIIAIKRNNTSAKRDKEKENLHNSLKSSVYKELYKKSLITDRELRLLLEKAPKFLN